jgi:hypothetical protein
MDSSQALSQQGQRAWLRAPKACLIAVGSHVKTEGWMETSLDH